MALMEAYVTGKIVNNLETATVFTATDECALSIKFNKSRVKKVIYAWTARMCTISKDAVEKSTK